jgi:DNA polymerase
METGVPFTEASGYLVDHILDRVGLRKWDVFVTNVVHCHPPGNRASEQSEKVNCVQWLNVELDIVRPDLVVALGRDAIGAMLVSSGVSLWSYQQITRNMGNWELKVLPVAHPAYFGYKPNAEKEAHYVEEIGKAVANVYREFGSNAE